MMTPAHKTAAAGDDADGLDAGGPTLLLAVPNISEGRDRGLLNELAAGFSGLRLLDMHVDVDHGRSVFTFAGKQGDVAGGLAAGAAVVVDSIDVSEHDGIHPHIGALDVCPVVYLKSEDRGAACAEALLAANLICDLGVPVFLYGQLSGGRERAELRAGGLEGVTTRLEGGELRPDFGPHLAHRTAGATLVTARPPLVAFNLELASGTVEQAAEIASELRESGGGMPGVRAIGLWLATRGRAQVSFNVHDPLAVPLVKLIEQVASRAEIAQAELVGLAPAAAFVDFPEDLPIPGFDPQRHLIENAAGFKPN